MDAQEAVAITSAPGRPLTVDEVLDELATAPDDDDAILDVLDRGAEALVSHDLVHRLVPCAARLRDIDYSRHPWAALPAGTAICAIDRDLGRRVLATARETFAAANAACMSGAS